MIENNNATNIEFDIAFKSYIDYLTGRYKVKKVENSDLSFQKPDKITTLLEKISAFYNLKLDAPITVGLDITDKCNADCIHCFHLRNQKGESLKIDEYKKLITELAEMNVLNIYITGGEPLLNEKKVMEIIKEIKIHKGIRIELFTNGTLISDQMINFLKKNFDNKYHDAVQVSLDGPNAELHNKQRPGADFEIILTNIKKLTENNIPCRINVSVSSLNFNKMTEIYLVAHNLGVNAINFSPVFPLLKGKNMLFNDFDTLLIEFHKLYVESKNYIRPVIGIDPLPILLYGILKARPLITKENVSLFTHFCPAGKTIAEIDCFGNVFSCYYLHNSQFSAGNIRNDSFKSIWQNPKSWSNLQNRNLTNTICDSCAFFEFCLGNCPAAAFHKFGNINMPDPRCEYFQESMN